MNATFGKAISGDEHLAQSIGDILSTPIGTRVGRRDYGSDLFELIDAPLNPLTRLRVIAATAVALAHWETRFRLTKVLVGTAETVGQAVLQLTGVRTDQPSRDPLTLSIPLTV